MLHRIIYPYKLFIFNGYVQSPALPLLTILTPPEGPISKTTVDWTAQAVKVIPILTLRDQTFVGFEREEIEQALVAKGLRKL